MEDSDADAAAVTADAERVQSDLAHRKLVVPDADQGQALATGLAEEGWNVSRLLVMVRNRPRHVRRPRAWARRSSRSAGAAALAAFRREQPFGWQDRGGPAARGHGRALSAWRRARDFAAPAGRRASALPPATATGAGADRPGGDAAGAAAARGYASAAVLAAADAAAADGHDPVFLLTDGGDWPQHLYRRLGFDEIGAV